VSCHGRAVAVLALLCGLAGCGGGGDHARSSDRQPTVSPSPTQRLAADGTDVAACRDGECQIAVSGRVDVPLDPKFDITRLSLKPQKDGLRMEAQDITGMRAVIVIALGDDYSLGSVVVRFEARRGGAAIVDFSQTG
jgi:hypothetical protein